MNEPICLLGSSISDMNELQKILLKSSVLSQYLPHYQSSSNLKTKLPSIPYLNHDLPFQRIENELQIRKETNFLVLTKANINVELLKRDQLFMTRYPYLSFFFRNSELEHVSNQWLLNDGKVKILLVSLYKQQANKLTIKL